MGDRGYGSAKHVRVALRALPSARRQLERRRCGRSSDTHARAHTDARTHARTGRLDLSRISSRLSADGSVSCLAWTRVQLFLHPLPQRWRSELLDSLSLSLSVAALIPSFCFADTWTRGGTADDDAAAALHPAEVRIVGISAGPPGVAWNPLGPPASFPGPCCCSHTWRESASACRTCSDSVSLLSLICFSRARQTLTGVCV